MPFPCCPFCYDVYLRKDGSIDGAKYAKLIKEKNWSKDVRDYYWDNPCTCECHTEDRCIMH